MEKQSQSMIKTVVVHPLVLLSVVDHYTRVLGEGGQGKRVVGVLLGELSRGRLDITNSYAVPFEEDPKQPTIWYLDHLFHEDMYAMFKKVNAKEKVVGWYSTGPKIRPADIEINELLRRYTADPVLVIIDVNPKDDLEIPTEAYISLENLPEEKSKARRTFAHIPSEIGAYEPEEVGVEHLLRNIRDRSVGSISDKVQAKLASLHGLKKRIEEMHKYLCNVLEGSMPINHHILYNIQDMINLLPDLRDPDMVEAFSVKNNDNMLVLYLSSLIRSIIALHNLISNKLNNRALESKESSEHKEKEKDKEKVRLEQEKKDKEDKEKKDKEEKEKKAEEAWKAERQNIKKPRNSRK